MKIKIVISFLISLPLYAQINDSLLTLSEVMFAPQSGSNEFIELYNLSETESFDLSSYKIKYQDSNDDLIIETDEGTILPPNSFAVILEGDYDFEKGIYKDLIPGNSLILKISDNSFGSSGMSNSSDRLIRLINASGDTIDSYTYSANNSSGFSDEKIILNKDNSLGNWSNSVITNGTPGFKNSVTPLEYDLKINSISYSPNPIFEENDLLLSAIVENEGSKTADNFTFTFYNDVNLDNKGDPEEIIYNQNFQNLLSDDSLEITHTINSISAGNYNIISQIIFPEDEDTSDNQKEISFTVIPPFTGFNSVVINEIMYSPVSGEPEWIELLNTTDKSINLFGFRIADNTSGVLLYETVLGPVLAPHEFIVITADESVKNFYDIPVKVLEVNLPSLNNSGDAISLRNINSGELIDSVSFLPDWGGTNGYSLERISSSEPGNNSFNWKTSESIFKATPGKINSVTPKNYDLKFQIFKPLTIYAVIGEEVLFEISIINSGLNNSGNFLIKIFSDLNIDSLPQQNELIAELPFDNLLTGNSSTYIFSTTDFSNGLNKFIGQILFALDEDTTNNFAFSDITGVTINEGRYDLIINEIMYAPSSGEPEWIEIFNRSGKTINLKNYKIADNSDTLLVLKNNLTLSPKEYLIISSDNSVKNFYTFSSDFISANLPSFNNSGDKLILLDSLNRVIDSLQYFSSWGGISGKSLERINSDVSSVDSANWKTSLSKYKATPGLINSVTQKDYDLLADDIIFSPQFPFFDDDVSVSVKVKNLGKNPAVFNIKLFEDVNKDSAAENFLEEINNISINSSDSVIVNFNHTIEKIKSEKNYYIFIDFSSDEDTTNNSLLKTVTPGFQPSSIIINEVMYHPSGGEPEWIELYNTSDQVINIKGWVISDVVTTPVNAIINSDAVLNPKSFLVITKDSSISYYHRYIPSGFIKANLPVLNNDADGVVLKDNRGVTIDSLLFNNTYGGTGGYSLERKSYNASSNLVTNWASSSDIEMSTPGRINSITPKQFDISISEISFEPRFPVAGDDVFIHAEIKNNGSAKSEGINISFFISDSSGNNISLLSSQSDIEINPSDSVTLKSIQPIKNLQEKILIFIRVFSQNDEDTLNNYAEKFVEPGASEKTIIISEIMFNPADDEPEWIEIYNRSGEEINLINWSVSDLLSSPTISFISLIDLVIKPGEYFIISRDTSFKNFYPETTNFISSGFGSLSNTEDGIIIYDFRMGIIDSVKYNSKWGGKKGYSLERISFDDLSNDSSNWTTSLDQSGASPGKENSVVNIPSYQRNSLIINEIMFDPDIDNNEFIEFYNTTGSEINIGGWRIEDQSENYFKISETGMIIPANSYFLFSADTLPIAKYNLAEFPYKNISNAGSIGLTNSGELILLKDIKGNTIDSVFYSDKWHNKNFTSTKNRSLERINPLHNGNDNFNWSTSADYSGATPGKVNSILADNPDLQSKISVSPNPFSPDDDGFEDFSIINYNLKQPVSQIRIRIFDSKGRNVRTLVNNMASGSNGSVIFNGLDDENNSLRIGIYIILLEAVNENAGIVETLKTTIVVARKL